MEVVYDIENVLQLAGALWLLLLLASITTAAETPTDVAGTRNIKLIGGQKRKPND